MLYLPTTLTAFAIGYYKAVRDAQTGDRGQRRGRGRGETIKPHTLNEYRRGWDE